MKILLVVVALAAAIYLTVRLIQRRAAGKRPPRQRPGPPRVTGPDDDPDFLRGLEKRRDDDPSPHDDS